MNETVRNRGLSILSGGFSVDEANHEGVCAHEISQEEQQNAEWCQAMKYDTHLAYTKNKADAVAAHAIAFSKSHAKVFGTLSHSHLLLILRARSSGGQMAYQGEQQGRRLGTVARS